MRIPAITYLAISLTACASVHPPSFVRPPSPPRFVAAPFAKTWDAGVDAFAEKNIGIKTIDRTSGLIVAEPVRVEPPVRLARGAEGQSRLADCGRTVSSILDVYHWPTFANYNVRIRGDSAGSTVSVTVRWTAAGWPGPNDAPQFDCVSKGVWERELEDAIKARAEQRAPR